MGSGGGVGYSVVPAHIATSHATVMMGEGAFGGLLNWADVSVGDYDANPSALRFLIEKGITDAGGNPFEGVSAYVPDEQLDEARSLFSNFRSRLDTIDPEGNWTTFFDAAFTKAGEILPTIDRDALLLAAVNRGDVKTVMKAATDAIDTGALDDSVDSYRRRSLRQHLRSVNRFAGGMADVNAVHSSAFILGLANLEGDYEMSVEDYRTRASVALIGQALSLFMSSYQKLVDDMTRKQIVNASFAQSEAQRMLAIQSDLLRLESSYAAQGFDLSKMNIVAKVDEQSGNLEYDVKSAVWDLELFQMVGNLISSSTGAVVQNAGKPSKAQSAIGGVLSGAGAGAEIGNMIGGPVGAGYGMGAGALLGGIAGLLE